LRWRGAEGARIVPETTFASTGDRFMNDMTGAARPAVDASKFRLLHTMIRVQDLNKSLDFYTRLLGMRLLWKKDYPSGGFTLAFVGYGDEESNAVIELTHNWGREEPYEIGTGFGHLAIGVPDIYGVCKVLEREGVKIPRPPGPMAHGGSVIAFIQDPDGYKIELIARK
jgi:lactoylglutathione lyase